MSDPRISKSPNLVVALLLGVWWVLNLVLGATLELSNDEAYYWAWTTVASEGGSPLSWGYFDHPPMVALMVWLSSFLPGSLGVRFFSLLLLPLALYLFWSLIRPPRPSLRDAWIYVLVCFAMPILQLYGLLALPDAPLLFFSVVVLWAFKRLVVRDRWIDVLWLALSVALLGYSKYQGLLVILLLVLSHPRTLRSPKIYVAALGTLILYLPHLWWQYHHGWPSFAYHIFERNEAFEWENIGDFLLSLLLVFNPLFLYHCVWKGWRLSKNGSPRQTDSFHLFRALLVLAVGFVVFFSLSSLKKYVQVQWVLPIVFPLVWAVWNVARGDELHSGARYLRVVAVVSTILFLVVRIVLLFNPFAFKYEVWDNRESYGQIAALADGRPVQFSNDYAASSKYAFYTHQPTYTLPVFYGRESQWRFCNADEQFVGKDVVVQVNENCFADTMLLANGSHFQYVVIHDFHPTRKVSVSLPSDTLSAAPGDTLHLRLTIDNPYDYDLCSSQEPMAITMFFKYTQRLQPEYAVPLTDTLKAHTSTVVLLDVPLPSVFASPEALLQDYPCGICVGYTHYCTSRNSDPLTLRLVKNDSVADARKRLK